MHYYEHHIGDYAEATAHLTFVEDAAYCRLIRKYYATEKPLPSDVKSAQRLVGARDKAEKEAVEIILNEFFELRDDGWHNQRCDEEIVRYIDGEPERELKKSNEKNRLKNHRDERSRLFKELTELGGHAPWNIGIKELRFLVSEIQKKQPETPLNDELSPLPATAPATPATANQEPLTTYQEPLPINKTNTGNLEDTGELTAGGVCLFLREKGMTHTNPAHGGLIAALQDGATIGDFEYAAIEAMSKAASSPFPYALKIVTGRIEERKNAPKKPKSAAPKVDPGFAEKYADIGSASA